jgi:hypothetical protein
MRNYILKLAIHTLAYCTLSTQTLSTSRTFLSTPWNSANHFPRCTSRQEIIHPELCISISVWVQIMIKLCTVHQHPHDHLCTIPKVCPKVVNFWTLSDLICLSSCELWNCKCLDWLRHPKVAARWIGAERNDCHDSMPKWQCPSRVFLHFQCGRGQHVVGLVPRNV